jgi:hypothetical protein
MSLWRIWYTDGALACGWLGADRGNGHVAVYEDDEENAKAQAAKENEADRFTLHMAFPADIDGVLLEEEDKKMRREVRRRQRAQWAEEP